LGGEADLHERTKKKRKSTQKKNKDGGKATTWDLGNSLQSCSELVKKKKKNNMGTKRHCGNLDPPVTVHHKLWRIRVMDHISQSSALDRPLEVKNSEAKQKGGDHGGERSTWSPLTGEYQVGKNTVENF